MKIERKREGRGLDAAGGRDKKTGAGPAAVDGETPSFITALDAATGDQQVGQQLDDLFRKIEEQSAVLVEKRSDAELTKFRDLVKAFMTRVVEEGLKVSEVQSAKFMENGKVFLLARQVETKLLTLAERLRSGHAEALEVAAAASEIRGLLLDMRA